MQTIASIGIQYTVPIMLRCECCTERLRMTSEKKGHCQQMRFEISS